jgi:hypothetical protein
MQRIGCGPSDGEEIMRHSFFQSINWTLLSLRQIDPPFVPKVSGDLDTSNFDKEFTELPPVLTPLHADTTFFPNTQVNDLDGDSTDLNLIGFTYVAESLLNK